jgi:dTDP-4-dehydrorhamnose reductase
MKVLVSGSSGLFGSALTQAAPRFGHLALPLLRSDLDWHDLASNHKLFAGVDIVVHAAANTNVEQCEKEPEACYRDNAILSEIIAAAAANAGCKLVYVSSTGVYGDHKSTPYCEYDQAQPGTHHHRSKLMAEQIVLRHCPDALVIRTGWLFGGLPGNPKNFVMRRIEEARAAGREPISSNTEQRGNPSYVRDVVWRVFQLLALQQVGVFNVVGSGAASRFEYVSEIIKLAALANEVQPTSATHFQRLANVANNETAANWKAGLIGMAPMANWRESLAKYMRDELNLP